MKNKLAILNEIGNTQLITLNNIHIKLEHLNPSGSIKDRIAKYIVEKAEKTGKLKKGYTIIEATSGNTGIAFSMVSAIKRYKMIVIMPKGMSKERTKIIKSYGAKIVYVKPNCFSCAIEKANSLAKKPKTFRPKQFTNPWNVQDHEKHLGPEILKQLKDKKIDAIVAGVGTGGTLIGVGKSIKKKFPKVKLFAIEPSECPAMALEYKNKQIINKYNKTCKHHDIEGIGDGLIPGIIQRNKYLINGIIEIKSKDAIKASIKLKKLGYFVGPSSGANFLGAQKLKKLGYKNIVTFFCDDGDRYLSDTN